MMATTGNPDKAALLVIDVQNGVMATGWSKDQVIENCARLVEHAHASDMPVIWIQHQAEDLPRDSEKWQLVPELAPNEGDLHVYKEHCDSFAATELRQLLGNLDIGHVTICGAQTNACVRATTYRAAGEGFDVTLVEDAHTTEDIAWDGIELSAKSMVDDLNLTLKFVDWPGQTVQSVPTDDVLSW